MIHSVYHAVPHNIGPEIFSIEFASLSTERTRVACRASGGWVPNQENGHGRPAR
jgi:hypothetical protein